MDQRFNTFNQRSNLTDESKWSRSLWKKNHKYLNYSNDMSTVLSTLNLFNDGEILFEGQQADNINIYVIKTISAWVIWISPSYT